MLRIYVTSKFSEDADAAGPGKIMEPGMYFSIGNFAFYHLLKSQYQCKEGFYTF